MGMASLAAWYTLATMQLKWLVMRYAKDNGKGYGNLKVYPNGGSANKKAVIAASACLAMIEKLEEKTDRATRLADPRFADPCRIMDACV